ncbi:hypothetical protein MexAM1_META1p2373 [Methylorubrum extorquens AM1]|uniref:Uncharacterized protein n=1 Tax=Methylorubrum extorquens (strain ATCC 14718 / DSM 1338 / JCM 2805 / NCIMB 9133 / AM1) TaxID=272630 RepID=C5AQQ9_METEA|nr:hypothetical protein MexAM1_META1p2373 [Methylorubrum extorquens AM1]
MPATIVELSARLKRGSRAEGWRIRRRLREGATVTLPYGLGQPRDRSPNDVQPSSPQALATGAR